MSHITHALSPFKICFNVHGFLIKIQSINKVFIRSIKTNTLNCGSGDKCIDSSGGSERRDRAANKQDVVAGCLVMRRAQRAEGFPLVSRPWSLVA